MPTRHYTNRNIDLKKLGKSINEWFADQEYETQSNTGQGDILIQARKGGTFRTVVGATRAFNITVSGSPNDFAVSFGIGDWSSNLAAVGIGTLLTGGVFLIGSGLAASWSKKIEADFLKWLDMKVMFGNTDALKAKDTMQIQNLHSTEMNEKLQKLKQAWEAGILSEEEYSSKVNQLKKDSNPDDQLRMLDEAFRSGIINEKEYMQKKGALTKSSMIKKLEAAFESGILTKEELDKKLAEFNDDVEFIN